MAIFYATFMQKQATKNHYVKFTADSMGLAREAMHAHFGAEWMTVYDEKGFEGQTEEFNLKELLHIHVIAHEHSHSDFRIIEQDGKT